MQNDSYSRWLAVPIGAAIGIAASVKAIGRGDISLPPMMVCAGGALLGAAAGSVVFVLDRPKSPDGRPLPTRPTTVLAGLLAAASLLLACVPLIGLAVSLPAMYLTRRMPGWAWWSCRVSYALGVTLIACFLIVRSLP